MNPYLPPVIQEPIRYPVNDNAYLIDIKDQLVKDSSQETIRPYGYEDTKDYSWR